MTNDSDNLYFYRRIMKLISLLGRRSLFLKSLDLFVVAHLSMSLAGCKNDKEEVSKSREFVAQLSDRSVKDKITNLQDVKKVQRYSVSLDPQGSISSTRLYLRLESDTETRLLRNSLSAFVSLMVSEMGGEVTSSEIGFPPYSFSTLAVFDDGLVKADGVLCNASGEAVDLVVFIARVAKP